MQPRKPNAPAVRDPQTAVQNLTNWLAVQAEDFVKVMPRSGNEPIERVMERLQQAISWVRIEAMGNPKMARCQPVTIFRSVAVALWAGLVPSGASGEFYLIPRYDRFAKGERYDHKCTFIIGYKGYEAMALKARPDARILAKCVYDGEEFEFDFATGEFTHAYKRGVDRSPAKLSEVYCVIRDGQGTPLVWDCLPASAILATARRSSTYSAEMEAKHPDDMSKWWDGPWSTDFDAMSRKTAIRQLLSQGRMLISQESMAAIRAEQCLESGGSLSDVVPYTPKGLGPPEAPALQAPPRPSGKPKGRPPKPTGESIPYDEPPPTMAVPEAAGQTELFGTELEDGTFVETGEREPGELSDEELDDMLGDIRG